MKNNVDNKKLFHLPLVLSIVVIAGIVILSYFFVSIEKVTGEAMAPSLNSGDIVFVLKTQEINNGDIITFYHGNQMLVRRCIGNAGDTVSIDEEGTVSVNGKELEEPYVRQNVSEIGDMQFPYQIPADRCFVLSDDRAYVSDSRIQVIGSISKKQVVGKVLFRIWPLGRISDG